VPVFDGAHPQGVVVHDVKPQEEISIYATVLADIWRILRRQANGESGALQTNSAPNIFFVRDVMGVLGVVDILSGGAGWEIGASPIGEQRAWPVGARVFFP
jgi:hypothetical protein